LDPSFDLGQRSFQGRDLCQLALALQITDRGYLMVASVVIMSHITSQLGKELGRRIVLLLFRKRSRIVSFDESETLTQWIEGCKGLKGHANM
jgi:hypothetical protein